MPVGAVTTCPAVITDSDATLLQARPLPPQRLRRLLQPIASRRMRRSSSVICWTAPTKNCSGELTASCPVTPCRSPVGCLNHACVLSAPSNLVYFSCKLACLRDVQPAFSAGWMTVHVLCRLKARISSAPGAEAEESASQGADGEEWLTAGRSKKRKAVTRGTTSLQVCAPHLRVLPCSMLVSLCIHTELFLCHRACLHAEQTSDTSRQRPAKSQVACHTWPIAACSWSSLNLAY